MIADPLFILSVLALNIALSERLVRRTCRAELRVQVGPGQAHAGDHLVEETLESALVDLEVKQQ